jgi:hypothetical protein
VFAEHSQTAYTCNSHSLCRDGSFQDISGTHYSRIGAVWFGTIQSYTGSSMLCTDFSVSQTPFYQDVRYMSGKAYPLFMYTLIFITIAAFISSLIPRKESSAAFQIKKLSETTVRETSE